MGKFEEDLASFARHHGRALSSEDPMAVLEAEAALAGIWDARSISAFGRELGVGDAPSAGSSWLRREPKFGFAAGLLGTTLFGSAVGGPIGRVVASIVSWSPLWTTEGDSVVHTRNSAVLESTPPEASAALRTIGQIERTLGPSGQVDWGVVGLGFGPVLESALHDPLVNIGRLAWEKAHGFQHRFYQPPLASLYEKGQPPTLVTYEAIVYLLQHAEGLRALLSGAAPIGTRYLGSPHLLVGLSAARTGRNALHHAGRAAWSRSTYGQYCDVLFGYPSLSEWLEGDFTTDESGSLQELGHRVLSALLVTSHFTRSIASEPHAALPLLALGLLSRADLPPDWPERLSKCRSSEVADTLRAVRVAIGSGVLSAEEFGTSWTSRLLDATTIDGAVTLTRRNSVATSDFSSAWKTRAAATSTWSQLQELLGAGLLSHEECGSELRREKLSVLGIADARRAVEAGADPAEFNGNWRLRMTQSIEQLGLKDTLWLAEHGLLGDSGPSKERLAHWIAKCSRADAVRLVKAGLAVPSDFRPSWRGIFEAALTEPKEE